MREIGSKRKAAVTERQEGTDVKPTGGSPLEPSSPHLNDNVPFCIDGRRRWCNNNNNNKQQRKRRNQLLEDDDVFVGAGMCVAALSRSA